MEPTDRPEIDQYVQMHFKTNVENAVETYLKFSLPFGSDILNVEYNGSHLQVSYNNRSDEKDEMIKVAIDNLKQMT